MITWDDFSKIDIRVGTVIEVAHFPEAHKPAYQLKIDFGELGTRKSSAQLTDLYTKETLTGTQVIAVVNFPPKQIARFMSECLVLGIVGAAGGIVLLRPDTPVPDGLQIG